MFSDRNGKIARFSVDSLIFSDGRNTDESPSQTIYLLSSRQRRILPAYTQTTRYTPAGKANMVGIVWTRRLGVGNF